jgi:hypothetical protein
MAGIATRSLPVAARPGDTLGVAIEFSILSVRVGNRYILPFGPAFFVAPPIHEFAWLNCEEGKP